jgi:cytochrome c biogenesis protein CcdA/thiol-disulfide isomerase/thioredoxin
VLELIVVGVVAGFLAGISPCILPVLPVVLVAGATTGAGRSAPQAAEPSRAVPVATPAGPAGSSPAGAAGPAGPQAGLGRALAVIGGLVVSFSLLILVGSEVLSLLHLPQDSLRDAGIALLIVVGLGYLIPPLGTLLERPFARVGARRPGSRAGGFVLGLALGVLYVPCAGPILATITVLGATHRVGLTAVILTAAFAVGTAVPLLAVALAGGQLTGRVRALRRHAPAVRQVGGVVLVAMAAGIAFNVFDGLQRDIPGYSTALQGSPSIHKQLSGLTGAPKHTALAACKADTSTLVNCGPAPNFAGITTWLNTPGGRPLTLSGLRGKVVLVDFWTYSCINCQRTLPHVEAWYHNYAKDGFVVVGVHTPEFAFEHVVSNVKAQSAALGVHYPVAIDNNYATWNAYSNQYWPADYLINAQGDIRHVEFGEGNYPATEQLIRTLLSEAHPTVALPAPSDIPDVTPGGNLSPETYVGYERLQYLIPHHVVHNTPATYHFPGQLPPGGLGLAGTWTDHAQEATAGAGAELELSFLAKKVYLVLGGSGKLDVSIDGRHTQTVDVAGVPRLYTLFQAGGSTSGKLLLHASPGVKVYDFTFG